MYPSNPLESFVIRNYPGVGNATIVVIRRVCHKVTHLDISRFLGINAEGLRVV